jgi:hypothetical protein
MRCSDVSDTSSECFHPVKDQYLSTPEYSRNFYKRLSGCYKIWIIKIDLMMNYPIFQTPVLSRLGRRGRDDQKIREPRFICDKNP